MSTRPRNVTGQPQRIAISLSGEAAEAVKKLAEKHNVSAGEVVRRAIAVQRFIDDEAESGSTFLVRKPSGDLDRVQFIFA